MAKSLVCIGLILTAVVFVNAQTNPPPQPTPTPFLGRSETGLERIRRLDGEHERLAQQTYSNLYGQGQYANSTRYSPEWRAKMASLYRKPKNTELEILAPEARHRQEYAEFLKEKKTGLIRLIREQGCEVDGKVVNASPDCKNYNFPGAGASFSFRMGSYRIRRLADITLVKNSLITRGVLTGAIFVELGNIPIEDVDLNTPGLGFLLKYAPVKNAEDALDAAKRFARGVKKDGHIYGRGIYVSKSNTFAMRSIAYRGKFIKTEGGVKYNELDFDKRRDIIVAFRIIDVETDGAATIVWKILRDSKSPKLKINQK